MNRAKRTAAIRLIRGWLVDEALRMGANASTAERYATFELRRYMPLKNSILRAIIRNELSQSAAPDPLDSLTIVKEEEKPRDYRRTILR